MKIRSVVVENFASYKHLEFSFIDQGLTLISGPTGSGKSTLCDIIPWVLFGTTAKNGSVDEIRSWNSDETTMGCLTLNLPGNRGPVYIERSRSPNDLFFINHDHSTPQRGKDLNDTQKQLNQLLGMTAETYLAGAYLHEFSQTAQFFTLSAKNRRIVTEQLADLSLAKSLQEKLSAYNKELTKEKADLSHKLAQNKGLLEYLNKAHCTNLNLSKKWQESQSYNLRETETHARDFNLLKDKEIRELEQKHENFELEQNDKVPSIEAEIKQLQDITFIDYAHRIVTLKSEIDTLRESTCKECGAPKNTDQVLIKSKELYETQRKVNDHTANLLKIDTLNARLSRIKIQVNPYSELIIKAKDRKNTYLEQLIEMKTYVNPYIQILESSSEVAGSKKLEITVTVSAIEDLSVEQSDIELLLETIATFRSACIENTVAFLQHTTNKLLEDHFDAEIRVSMSSDHADKIDVQITKDGNQCSYTQLSKGQRQLLKLCFGVAVMQSVSNYNGTSFNCLFFDECLDGMDESIKAKSFTLLEKLALSHESVFVVEHSEQMKSLFTNRIDVNMENGCSYVTG